MQVVITRPQADSLSWADGLRVAGLEPLLLPLIDIEPVANPEAICLAWASLPAYAAVMFVSGNAVSGFFASKRPENVVQQAWPAIKTRAWATGPGTHRALVQAGVDAGLIDSPPEDAEQFDSQALWSRVCNQVKSGDKVLLVRGATSPDGGLGQSGEGGLLAAGEMGESGGARNWLSSQLEAVGVTVDFLVSYLRIAPVFNPQQQDLARAAAADGSVWLFSSSEAVGNLASALPGQAWGEARAVATHPRIAAAVRAQGWGVVCESRPTLPSVVASIESMR
jgi:uroporphyrinogen-III synthase